MLGPEMNAGLDAGPIQKNVRCRFHAGPGFWGKFDISNSYPYRHPTPNSGRSRGNTGLAHRTCCVSTLRPVPAVFPLCVTYLLFPLCIPYLLCFYSAFRTYCFHSASRICYFHSASRPCCVSTMRPIPAVFHSASRTCYFHSASRACCVSTLRPVPAVFPLCVPYLLCFHSASRTYCFKSASRTCRVSTLRHVPAVFPLCVPYLLCFHSARSSFQRSLRMFCTENTNRRAYSSTHC